MEQAGGHPWPLFDLRVRTPRLELRYPTDADLVALAALARAGIHAPDAVVFAVDWERLPSPAFEHQYLQHYWELRGAWRPEHWCLPLVALADGVPVGIQELLARDFAHRRTVETGSWLGRAHQPDGLGTEMRAAILWLAFEGLGALAAESGYLEGNAASARVSAKLGYRANGVAVRAPRGEPITEHRVRLTREQWRRDLVPVRVEGLERCLELFGVPVGGP